MNNDSVLIQEMGRRIKQIRNEMDMTKDSLAKAIGVTGQFLGVVEAGKSAISYDKLRKLCEISGYTSDYILFGKRMDMLNETKALFLEYNEEQIEDACEILKRMSKIIRRNPTIFD
ncbi:MAG: helix-turn-helix domain-containing protein [Clostridia bacterium]|nr:helix-turn-helix domain-containing protein [Clostridia bacterium]